MHEGCDSITTLYNDRTGITDKRATNNNTNVTTTALNTIQTVYLRRHYLGQDIIWNILNKCFFSDLKDT